MNTVVNTYNWEEDMNENIAKLAPYRWKVFQCLLLEGENWGENAEKDVIPFLIDDEKFRAFVDRHITQNPIAEDNDTMRDSYLLLDQEMRFLNCVGNKKVPGKSILIVGVEAALRKAGFNHEKFIEREGIFEWTKPTDQDHTSKI